MATSILKTLQAACKGLLFPSEQDNPVKAFVWQKSEVESLDAETVRRMAKVPEEEPVDTQPLEEFFAPAVTMQDWYGEEEKARTTQFQSLADTLKQQLQEVKVYRFGETDKTVYVVGKTPEGDIAGVRTRVVET